MPSYLKQIQRAVDFIEAHLHDELGPEEIARHAGISFWHFQRIFSATMQYSVMDYVRRRRLSVALDQLMSTKRGILDIALDSGFESQEAFTRAFKAMFGRTPGRCRGPQARVLITQSIPQISVTHLTHLYSGITMTPTLQDVPARIVVGIGGNFISVLSPDRNNFVVIPQLWERFIPRRSEIPHIKDPHQSLGCIVCPTDAAPSGHPSECHYIACAEVTAVLASIPDGMEVREIPAGRYAVFVHKGKLDTLNHTMNFIYASWLPRSGEQLRDAPEVEIYGERFDPSSDDSEMEICIPVQG